MTFICNLKKQIMFQIQRDTDSCISTDPQLEIDSIKNKCHNYKHNSIIIILQWI